jgi:hypothetical protein
MPPRIPTSLPSLGALAARRGRAQLGAAVLGGAALAAGGLAIAALAGGKKPDPYKDNFVGFPQDLDTLDHYIEFVAQETKGVGTGAIESALGGLTGGQVNLVGSKINGGTIRLPLPSNLSVDYHPEYSAADLGAGAAGAALKAGDRAIYGNSDISGLAAAGGALAGAGIEIAAGAAGAALGIEGGIGSGGTTGAAALKVAAGVAQNPHKIVLFTGVNFRDHTFSWKLSPRNRRESDLIRQIINMFTYYAHPEYVGGGLFFKYPEFFKIRFNHPEYLFELQPSVCTGIKVDYHSQGYAAYVRLANGQGPPAPAEVSFTVTMKETEIITKDFLNKDRLPLLETYTSQMEGREGAIGGVHVPETGQTFGPGGLTG